MSGVHELIFRGLAVRMVIASGKIEACAKHAVTHRTEYIGEPILRTPCAQLSGLHSTAISNPAAAVSESSTTSLTDFFHGRALPSSVYDELIKLLDLPNLKVQTKGLILLSLHLTIVE